MKILKSRIFLVLVSVILATTITAYATISPNSESIIYDNTNSGITATNMQDAIDELYNKANSSSSSGPLVIDEFTMPTPRTNSGGGGVYGYSNLTVNTEEYTKLSIEQVKAYGSAGYLDVTGFLSDGTTEQIERVTTGDYYVSKEWDINDEKVEIGIKR